MKKICLLILFFTTFLLLLTGCASVANEKKIQSDLESNIQFSFFSPGEKIEKFEIEKRQTDKKRKTDTIWCTITTEDTEISYQKSVVLIYGLYDKGGWILDDVSVNDSSQWIQIPLKGIDEENIADSLKGQFVTANGEDWGITTDSIKDISIDKHDTNLEEKTDIITATLTLNADVEEAKGQLIINYKFDDGWKIDTISGNKEFTATVKPDVALNVTNDDLITAMEKQGFQYGESNQQTISIDKNAITNFVIENQESAIKGSHQTFDCSCTLSKSHAVFNLEARIQYYYDVSNGWVIQPITIMPEVVSVDIEGNWTGTYNGAPYSGGAVLSISEVTADGSITAVYSYSPTVISKYSEPGSYNVSGKIDMSTFLMKLTAGSWVNQPVNPLSITKSDISALLYIDDSKIEGLGQEGCPFRVKQ